MITLILVFNKFDAIFNAIYIMRSYRTMNVTAAFSNHINHILKPSQHNSDIFMQSVSNENTFKENGIVHMGIADNYSFDLWKVFGANIPGIRHYFGPIIVITDPIHAENLLKLRKNTESDTSHSSDGYCIGNRSANIIQKQVGKCNLFGCDETETHRNLRVALKNSLHDLYGSNLSPSIRNKLADHIKTWLHNLSQMEQFDLKEAIDTIVSIFFAVVVLGKDPNNINLTEITNLAQNFTHAVSNPFKSKLLDSFSNDDKLDSAHPTFAAGLYPLLEKNYPNSGNEMSIMLEKVGYSNIHSALSSLIYRLATNTDWINKNMLNELNESETHFYFDLTTNQNNNSHSKDFFYETLRLAPPVWLQARKVGKHGLQLDNLDKFPPYSLILIPNFILARHMRKNNPHQFDPHSITPEEKKKFNPFSFLSSPNTCPGKYIAIPLIELILGEIIANYKINVISAEENYEGGVALKFADKMMFKLTKINHQ